MNEILYAQYDAVLQNDDEPDRIVFYLIDRIKLVALLAMIFKYFFLLIFNNFMWNVYYTC